MKNDHLKILPTVQMTRTTLALRVSGVLLGAAVLLALAIIPTEMLVRGPSLCVWKNLLGIQCPTCGMTRAFSSILHGRFIQAIQFNKLVVVVFPMFCALLFREAVRVITHVISGYNVRHPKLTDAS